ncbi:hypothetical protein [Chengkuizengella sediminis]|uniref:hypothetical protein n=1 Tax=Chengkuizengella sediminis TaxID=1885917 RepID=UPI00138A6039|nr:hypothetical protein [Chengkuizengella sediminis]NDI33153.1 hypothetical protein [Chengkuizengella sediminis]
MSQNQSDLLVITLCVPPGIECEGTISGTVTLNGVPVEGAQVCFSSSAPNSVSFDPNSATTDENGEYTATVMIAPGTDSTVATIIASTEVNNIPGSDTQFTVISCPTPSITLIVPDEIECEGTIVGTVSVNGSPVEGAEVFFSSSDTTVISFNPNPATTENGNYSSTVTISPDTESTDAMITASTTVNNIPVSDSQSTTISCPSSTPSITLNVPEEIECEGTITGTVSINGSPVEGAEVFFSSSDTTVISFDPNPATTDENGEYTATVSITPGTESTTATITASTTVNDIPVSDTELTTISCSTPSITLNVPEEIECEGTISGTVTLNGSPVEGAEVFFSSSDTTVISFDPNPATTDENGEYSATVSITPGTESTTATITASTTVNNIPVSDTESTTISCPTPSITLNVPEEIECQGTITGTVTENGSPVEGAEVFFSSSEPDSVSFSPNPATTDENGEYSSTVTISPDTESTTATITAFTTVNNIPVSATESTTISCPTPSITLIVPEEIECDGTISGTVTENGSPVEGAEVFFSSSEPDSVSFSPNPATTDENGEYSSTVTISPDTESTTATITASTTVNNIPVSATESTTISCPAIMETIYVTNQFSNNFTAIDGATNTPITTEPTQTQPFRVAVTPNGQFAYIANLNSASVTVVRVSDNTVIDTVAVQGGSQNLVITPDGQFVYVYCIDAPAVSVIRVSDNTVIATIPVEQGNRGNTFNNIDITADGQFVYVTNTTSGTVSAIQTSTNTVVQTIPVTGLPLGIAAGEPNSEFVYVISNNQIVSVIRTLDQTVVDTIIIGQLSPNPQNIIITPDGEFVYVVGNSQFIAAVRTSDNSVVGSVGLSRANFVTDVIASPSSEFVYAIANQVFLRFGTFNVIDVATNTVVTQVQIGNDPQQLTVNTDGSRVYVSNSAPDSVNVIQTSDNTLLTTVPSGGNGGQGIAVTP